MIPCSDAPMMIWILPGSYESHVPTDEVAAAKCRAGAVKSANVHFRSIIYETQPSTTGGPRAFGRFVRNFVAVQGTMWNNGTRHAAALWFELPVWARGLAYFINPPFHSDMLMDMPFCLHLTRILRHFWR